MRTFDRHIIVSQSLKWMEGVRRCDNKLHPDCPSYFSDMKTKEWRYCRGPIFASVSVSFFESRSIVTFPDQTLVDITSSGRIYRVYKNFYNWAVDRGVDPIDVSEEDWLAFEIETGQ